MKLTENNDLIVAIPDALVPMVASGICDYITKLAEVERIEDARRLYQWYKGNIGLGLSLFNEEVRGKLEGR